MQNDGSRTLGVFLLYFAEIITLLVMESNTYYHDHLDRIGDRPSTLRDVTLAEMLVFLAITMQMGHCMLDKLTDYSQRPTNSTHFCTVLL